MFDKETYWITFDQTVKPRNLKDGVFPYNTITAIIKNDEGIPTGRRARNSIIKNTAMDFLFNYYTDRGWKQDKKESDDNTLIFKSGNTRSECVISIKNFKVTIPGLRL